MQWQFIWLRSSKNESFFRLVWDFFDFKIDTQFSFMRIKRINLIRTNKSLRTWEN